KTLLLSAAALMVASTVALSTNSVSASSYLNNPYYNTSRFLRQNGTQVLREARYASELKIRNLLDQYGIVGEEYKGYFNCYYRQARQALSLGQVDDVINSLERNLQERQDND
ncbi:hypothetical protein, partial [Streptococcus pyogenes]